MNTPPPDTPCKITDVADPDPDGRRLGAARKDARLKAALKANMARRKAQSRARATDHDNNNE